MAAPRRPGSTSEAYAGLHFAVSAVKRSNMLVMAWRWRYELGIAIGLAYAAHVLDSVIGTWWTLAVVTAALTVTITVAIVPESRRRAVACAWCIITPHRVRSGCAQAWIHSRSGRLPFILLTTSEPFGERVHLWCRAGICTDDFEAARSRLAASCWAQDVRVTSHARYSQLVTLDVIRHPHGEPEATARLRWRDDSDLTVSPDPGPQPPDAEEPAKTLETLPELRPWPHHRMPGSDEPAAWN